MFYLYGPSIFVLLVALIHTSPDIDRGLPRFPSSILNDNSHDADPFGDCQ